MKKGNIVSVTLVAIMILGWIGCIDCEDPDPETCPAATVEAYRTPADTLCFGSWNWLYTIKWNWSFLQEDWVISDTVYPGEPESEYEVLEYVYGSVNDREIYFNINGSEYSGCYSEWNSDVFQTSTGPSDTVISAIFLGWETPEFWGVNVGAYVPEESGDPIIAQISGLKMFYVEDEYEEGVRYRSRFVKVE
jgi:hypothetical protein